MSTPKEPVPAKLVMSIFSASEDLIEEARERSEQRWGKVQMTSGVLPFDLTDYYEEEFGGGLRRCFYCFYDLIPQDGLKDVKIWAWGLESQFTVDGRRRVNVDPGILTLERLVLSTGKNYTHRIYLGQGVFADLTLIFRGGSYRGLEWTYRDYAAPESIEFWNRVRKIYLSELKTGGYL